MNIVNFDALVAEGKILTAAQIDPLKDLVIVGKKVPELAGGPGVDYKLFATTVAALTGITGVMSITGYNVDNTNPLTPVILPVVVDGVTITGTGVIGNPFVAVSSGVTTVTGYNVNNTDPVNPVILATQVDGITITGTGVIGNPFVAVSTGVLSVTGYNVDNTDPINPVILSTIADGVTITGTGIIGDPFVAVLPAVGWLLDGNTVGSEKWLGTIDNFNLPFRVNNIERFEIKTNGSVFSHGAGSIVTNTNYGIDALISNTTGNHIVAIGAACLQNNTIGQLITAVGFEAGLSNIDGSFNAIFGYQCLQANISGNNICAFGYSTLNANLADLNSAYGHAAAQVNTTGTKLCAFGAYTLISNTIGDFSSAFGQGALGSNTIGSRGVAMGMGCLFSNVSGDGLVGLGFQAGYYETGSDKLFIDNQARASEADGRVKALVYGIFAATTAAQTFRVNAHLELREDIIDLNKTIDTSAGDSVTINSMSGRFRKDTSGTTFTLTNSYIINANTIIQLTSANAAIDAAATSWTVSAGAGSAVITFNVAPTTDFDMNFFITN